MSTTVALVRHGPTDWNAEKRLQGRIDRPLSAIGEDDVRAWRLPPTLARFRAVSSPLLRARQTAEILCGAAPETDPRLTEMAFGDWEGERLPDLRQRLGEPLQRNEDRGLDFTPPKGESPRMVFQRVLPFLQDVASREQPVLAVTHKGVIRVVYAMAVGWDMTGKIPDRLTWDAAHLFTVTAEGRISIGQLNLSLRP